MEDRRKVSVAQLHQAVFIPGAGNLPNVLQDSTQRTPGIKLSWGIEGLYVEYKGFEFVVPTANVACAVFEKNSK